MFTEHALKKKEIKETNLDNFRHLSFDLINFFLCSMQNKASNCY